MPPANRGSRRWPPCTSSRGSARGRRARQPPAAERRSGGCPSQRVSLRPGEDGAGGLDQIANVRLAVTAPCLGAVIELADISEPNELTQQPERRPQLVPA